MDQLIHSLPPLARGTAMTLFLSAAAVVLATGLGIVFALMQLFGGFILRAVVEVYLYIVRGVPLLVLLFAMHYHFPMRMCRLNR